MDDEMREYVMEAFGEKGFPTLRDFFAGCALAGYSTQGYSTQGEGTGAIEGDAAAAYKAADAMLAAREGERYEDLGL